MAAQTPQLVLPYINGQFVSLFKPDYLFEVINPARPAQCLAQTGWNKSLLDSTVQGMLTAQKSFSQLSFEERLVGIQKLISSIQAQKELFQTQMMLELSRSRLCVQEEWDLCEKLFSHLESYCLEVLSAKKESSYHQWQYAPVGMVLISSNVALPLYSLLSTALVSLAAGNAVCLCPSLHSIFSSQLLSQVFDQCHFPKGIVQFVYGNFEIFRRLVLTHQFGVIHYTGDEESLEQIRKDTHTQQDIRLILCGGGKNAAYVTASCQLDETIQKIVLGACLDAGQRLESTNLVFIENAIAHEFTEKFIHAMKNTPIGVAKDLNRTDVHVMGPLCSENSWERFLRFQGIAARESDQTLRWGKPIDNPHYGYFVSPGIHLIQPEKVISSVYACNAFFGPDVCLVPVTGHEQVKQILDRLPATRCFSVHTKSLELVAQLRKQTHVPSLLWNASTTDLDPLLPTMGKGLAGNRMASGLHFLLSTVYPQTLCFSSLLKTNEFQAKSPKPKRKNSKQSEVQI